MSWLDFLDEITMFEQASAHSDVPFLFFDVGSSSHTQAEFGKRWVVHPIIGNTSWVQTVMRQFSFTPLKEGYHDSN